MNEDPIVNNQADSMAWLGKTSFWYPDFVEASAWIDHAPFAFWIVGALKPRVIVELGTSGGYSYFSFCQAVHKLRLDTRCYAVDTWKGDEHAGFYGEDVFHRVNERNEAYYGSFSSLVRMSFDDALPYFLDQSIDLLHIDGRHYYEDVKQDFESWLPKLSDRAVVLFHDINARERNFGVFRYWDELKAKFPSFEFLHGYGLGVLGFGPALPAKMVQFFRSSDANVAADVRAAYGRLGAGLKSDLQFSRMRLQLVERVRAREGHAAALEVQIRNLSAQLQARDSAIEDLNAKLKKHVERIEEYSARLNRRERRIYQLKNSPVKRMTKTVERSLRNLRKGIAKRAKLIWKLLRGGQRRELGAAPVRDTRLG